MSNSATQTITHTRSTLLTSGRWCAAAGLLGVLQGLALLVWPAQVSDERLSYPLTTTGHVVAQATFFLQHLPLLYALVVLAAAVNSKPARYGLITASIGIGLLAVMELVTIAGATTTEDSSLASAIYASYGPPVLLAGAGLTLAGIVLVRRTELDLRIAWLLTALGVWVFVGLTPALSVNSFVAGRLAIIIWMLLFTGLGAAMTTQPSGDTATSAAVTPRRRRSSPGRL